MSRYHIEVSNLGISRETSPWSEWESLVAEGDTLKDLLDDATIWAMDQDGGEAGHAGIYDLGERDARALEMVVIEQFVKRYLPELQGGVK